MVGQGTSPLKKKTNAWTSSVFSGSPSDLDGGRFFFNAVKEGDSVVFAADDEAESHLWVMALYRATGQSHKPTPPLTPQTQGKSSTITKIQGGLYSMTAGWRCKTPFPSILNRASLDGAEFKHPSPYHGKSCRLI